MERAEPRPRLQRPAGPGRALPRERGARPGPRRAPRADGMRLRERSLRQDPDLRQELASLARGCDFVLPSRFKKRLKAFQQVQTLKQEPLPPATSQSIPTFYFPRGRPQDSVNVDAVISKIEGTFAQFPQERASMDDMGLVAKACGCPLYWKGPLFYGAGGERTGSVSVHKFVAMWRKILHTCHDDAAKFVHLLMSPGCNYLVQEDFVPFLQDVVNTHPGLSFLKEASEFHSRYITTVSTCRGRGAAAEGGGSVATPTPGWGAFPGRPHARRAAPPSRRHTQLAPPRPHSARAREAEDIPELQTLQQHRPHGDPGRLTPVPRHKRQRTHKNGACPHCSLGDSVHGSLSEEPPCSPHVVRPL
ncbi:serine/threonine-protein phosphatase 2A regulatory subunit B'' subunit beta, partial [Aotus nancymaae]|uniref:serine/threonine-protein phosphatase 2A regulatory subunit B'' subunit beta n=1 Tax=Aotus nancymaae TaxID=37293 RepID=UPI0030FEC104